jgi:exopolyphosphatase/guanosine-5'-triphosphate,3'-diphosphate pyrophosphatase
MIKHGNLRGLSGEEVEMVANVARYHGGPRPRKKDPAVRAMSKRDRRALRWLAAILRIAEGLDRSRYQLVRGLRVDRRDGRVSIRLAARRDARLEVWAARRRTRLLERLLGERVRVGVIRPRPGPGESRSQPPRSERAAERPREPS